MTGCAPLEPSSSKANVVRDPGKPLRMVNHANIYPLDETFLHSDDQSAE